MTASTVARLRVVDALRAEGAASRADLVRTTGLSRATVSVVVSALRSEGLVVEEPESTRASGRGRRAGLLRFNSSAHAVLGIAFDRRCVRVAVADLSLEVLGEETAPLELGAMSAEEALAATRGVVDRVIRGSRVARSRLTGAGVSIPAPLDLADDRIAVPGIIPTWADVQPRRAFEELTGLPVAVDNDANLAALAEQRAGAARGLSDFVYIKLSPGVGAAIVSRGRVYRGATGFAGEVGHIRAGEHGPVCVCGNRGCAGPPLSMSSWVELLRPTHGDALTPARVLELLAARDPDAIAIVRAASRELGRMLANVCNVLNPAAVVLGGAPAPVEDVIAAGVRSAIGAHALRPIAESVRVTVAQLDDRRELVGALAFAPLPANSVGRNQN